MGKPDSETPQSGLQKRRGPIKVGGDLSGRIVPCRQCGAEVELTTITLGVWEASTRYLKRADQPPLERDEIVRCDRKECKQAELGESRRRNLRAENETRGIIEAIERGEAVQIPSEIIKYRPGCHARIKAVLAARREGTLPTRDAEID